MSPSELWMCRRVCKAWLEEINRTHRFWKRLCVMMGIQRQRRKTNKTCEFPYCLLFNTWVASYQKRVMWLVVGQSGLYNSEGKRAGVEEGCGGYRLYGAYVCRIRAVRIGELVYCRDDLDLSNSARGLLHVRYIPLPFPSVYSRLQVEMGNRQKRPLYVRKSFVMDYLDLNCVLPRSPQVTPGPFIDSVKKLEGWYASITFQCPEDHASEWAVTFLRY
jgi:hypothetical protein